MLRKFNYFRTGNVYQPRTPTTALRAFEAGIIPVDTYIYKSTSTKPLDEEPYDLEEIERVLAKENLDLETNLLLISIFEKLIKSTDLEIALFAAENINTIENRYNHSVEKLKKSLSRALSPAALEKIARLYYELSRIHGESLSIQKFYLNEAYTRLKQYSRAFKMKKSALFLAATVLINLKKYPEALKIIEKSKRLDYIRFTLLEIEIYFNMKQFSRIFQRLNDLKKHKKKLTDEESDILSYWLGKTDEK